MELQRQVLVSSRFTLPVALGRSTKKANMGQMKQYVLTLDLKDDEALIQEYEAHHKKIWPEIRASILKSGIADMKIFRWNNRLCMLMTVTEDFSFEKKAAADLNNPKVQEWETLMWDYQQRLAGTKADEKWVLMQEIFSLNN